MDRKEFIAYKRNMAVQRYNEIFSKDYDLNWGRIESVHNFYPKFGFIKKEEYHYICYLCIVHYNIDNILLFGGNKWRQKD